MTTREELAVHDFTAMSDVDLLDYCGDDASKWAEAFCQIKQKQGWSANDIDEGLMIGWFANAIERSSDVRRLASRQEVSVEELARSICRSDHGPGAPSCVMDDHPERKPCNDKNCRRFEQARALLAKYFITNRS